MGQKLRSHWFEILHVWNFEFRRSMEISWTKNISWLKPYKIVDLKIWNLKVFRHTYFNSYIFHLFLPFWKFCQSNYWILEWIFRKLSHMHISNFSKIPPSSKLSKSKTIFLKNLQIICLELCKYFEIRNSCWLLPKNEKNILSAIYNLATNHFSRNRKILKHFKVNSW